MLVIRAAQLDSITICWMTTKNKQMTSISVNNRWKNLGTCNLNFNRRYSWYSSLQLSLIAKWLQKRLPKRLHFNSIRLQLCASTPLQSQLTQFNHTKNSSWAHVLESYRWSRDDHKRKRTKVFKLQWNVIYTILTVFTITGNLWKLKCHNYLQNSWQTVMHRCNSGLCTPSCFLLDPDPQNNVKIGQTIWSHHKMLSKNPWKWYVAQWNLDLTNLYITKSSL